MPKMKTNRGAKKRFKMNKKGTIKRKKAFLRHILTSKRRGRKRHLRSSTTVSPADVKAIRQLLPYG
ncbi:MAG: 50S ribosomal protein L35 [Deltaproteobacteria bacterium]|nr:50S ribosomal protein L35 [Deltaproteobacteria bacterium]